MAGRDPEGRAAACHLRGRHSKFGKEKRESETNLAIEMKVEKPLDLPRLVAGLNGRRFLQLGRHT